MNRIKLTENFYLDEFICPEIYSARGAKAISLIDIRIVYAAQFIRDVIGKSIHVNSWWNGGNLHERGLREWNTSTGARWSQHKYGRAFDFHVDGMTPAQVHAVITQNSQTLIKNEWITTLEDTRDTPTWTHCDCRFTGLDHIQVVRA
jgi:hypothetical protein